MQDNEKNVRSIIDEMLDEIQGENASAPSKQPMEDISSSSDMVAAEQKVESPSKNRTFDPPTTVFKPHTSQKEADEPSKPIQKPEGFEEARRKRVEQFEIQKNVENRRTGAFSGNHDDYETVEDSKAVSDDLNLRFNFAKNIMTVSAVLLVLALAVNILPFVRELISSYSPLALLVVNTVLTLALIITNYSTVLGGVASFFRFRADIDSPIAMAALITIAANVTYFFDVQAFQNSTFSSAGTVLGAAFVMNNFGKLMLIRRIRTNFNLVANDKRKYAVTEIHGKDSALLTGGKVEGVIAFRKPTVNLLNFLNNSFSDDPVSIMYRSMSYVLLLAAVGITAFGVYKNTVSLTALSVLSALSYVMLLISPFAALLSAGVPISTNNRKLRKRRIILNGFGSVKRFASCEAVALTAEELFPKGTVQLISFDAVTDTDLEQTLTYAAALLKKEGGTLKGILDTCLEAYTGPLPEVTECERVSNVGIVGMVNGKPVLVGAAPLMDRFGIKGYDTSITGKLNRFRVYISVGGKLSAQLIIRYVPDKMLTKSLKLLADYGKRICVSSNDINVNERLITKIFGLDESCVLMLSDDGKEQLKMHEVFEESIDGSIGFFGKTSDFIDAITCCLRLRTCYAITKGIHIIFAITGALIALLCMNFGVTLAAVFILGFQAVTALLSILLPMVISRD